MSPRGMLVLVVVVVVVALGFVLVPRSASQHLAVDISPNPPSGILPLDGGLPPEPTRSDAGAPSLPNDPPPPVPPPSEDVAMNDVAIAGRGASLAVAPQ